MEGMRHQVQIQVKSMLQTFTDQYPKFIAHIFNGVNPSSPQFVYSVSTIQDVGALQGILRGMEVHLGNLEQVYSQWVEVRKDTIDHLNMDADELDMHRKYNNYAILGGSVAGAIGGGLGILALVAAAPTVGASVALVSLGGAVSAGSKFGEMGVTKVTWDGRTHHVNRDEKLTRQLAQEFAYLDEHIGRLGRWVPVQPMQVSRGMDILGDIDRAGASVASTCIKSAGFSKGAKDTVEGTAKGISVSSKAAIALLGVGVVVDVAMIAYLANDISNGSKTRTGQELRETAGKLDRELNEVRKIYSKIENESKLQACRRQLSEKNEEIAKKDEEIAGKDEEIARLRAQLTANDM